MTPAQVSDAQAINYRRLIDTDLDPVVAVHRSAFPDFFLTTMGPRFLRQLYRGFLSDSSGIVLAAVAGDDVVGFVAGTSEPEGFFRRLLFRRWYAFGLAALPGLARHPWRAGRKLLGALVYRGDKPPALLDSALLSSIGVAPSAGGRGIGRQLVVLFCEEARRRGCRTVYLTTDRDTNQPANNFYLHCGFTLESTLPKPPNRWMNRYVKELASCTN